MMKVRRRERPEDIALRLRIRELLDQQGLQQKIVAANLGVQNSAVCMALKGDIQVPPAWISRLSRLLDVAMEDITKGWRPRRGGCDKGEKRPGLGRFRLRKSPVKVEADRLLRERLTHHMAAHGRSCHDVATHLRISSAFLTHVLRGRAPLPRAWVKPLSLFFQLTVDEFVTGIPWKEGLPGARGKSKA